MVQYIKGNVCITWHTCEYIFLQDSTVQTCNFKWMRPLRLIPAIERLVDKHGSNMLIIFKSLRKYLFNFYRRVAVNIVTTSSVPVSYTHLDVYKRQ